MVIDLWDVNGCSHYKKYSMNNYQENQCVLYISYDGLMEPLGQSQVWQYLSGLSESYKIVLISYEKADDWADERAREKLKKIVSSKGVIWVPLRYHKKPSAIATAFDIFLGILVSGYLTLKHRVKILHARSYVPSVIALSLKKVFRLKFVFDMRGFWADERVERGIWAGYSSKYRIAKWFEKQFLINADAIISLTHAGVTVMRDLPYLTNSKTHFAVIPTCTDIEKFYASRVREDPTKIRLANYFVLGYVGSVDTAYMFEPVLMCFRNLMEMKENAFLLIVTRGSHEYVRTLLMDYEIPERCVEVKAVTYDRVAEEMRKMDAGIFFIKTGFSSKASAPTKFGEFLACGVPCLSNAGIGDMEGILEGERVGVVLMEFTETAMRHAVSNLLELSNDPEIRGRCINTARRYFSVEEGVKSYERIYYLLAEDVR